jgi:lysophospholipase L1-like esterase
MELAHIHSVYDNDIHFRIDGNTRTVRNASETKAMVVQHDHNSERFTFELPRIIDGHDMSTCNMVEVHFTNTDSKDRTLYENGVYLVDDLKICEEDNTLVICSWLISNRATKYVGKLSFSIRFVCSSEDGVVDYAWDTAAYHNVFVTESVFHGRIPGSDYVEEVLPKPPALDGKVYVMAFPRQTLPEFQKEIARNNIGAVATVNGVAPDENGNVQLEVLDAPSVDSGEPGADGFSPVATVTQTDEGALISITDKNGTTTATVNHGQDGSSGFDGHDGSDGVSPTVSVSKSGKVTTVSITDKDGTKTATINDGADGSPGSNGRDGTSATHSWNGTVLTVTSASGTSSADLKGEKGDRGDPGSNGTSVTVESVTESLTPNGVNTVTFSNGTSMSVQNGRSIDAATATALPAGSAPTAALSYPMGNRMVLNLGIPQGQPGTPGEDGHTPVRGVDYYTEADKAEFSTYIATELAKRGQLQPEFANSVAECTDTTKMYVLPDGMIYAYMKYESVNAGGQPLFTNMANPNSPDWKTDTRFSSTSGSQSAMDGAIVTNAIPAKVNDIIRIKGIKGGTGSTANALFQLVAYSDVTGETKLNKGVFFEKDTTGVDTGIVDVVTVVDGVTEYELFMYIDKNDNTEKQNAFMASGVSVRIGGVPVTTVDDIVITINEEIAYSQGSTSTGYKWASTGHAFVPVDYEDRIVALEQENARTREEIADLQEQIDSGAASAKSGAKWFALGDSITEGWASAVDSSQSSGYKQFFNTNTAQRWVNIVAEKNGYELTNYGVGGTGYAHHTSSTVNARAQVANIDFSECDFVTLAYGVNDWKGKATLGSMSDDVETVDAFVPNMRYVIKKILTDNPYCKIFVITPLNCRSLGTYDTNWGIDYANADNASGPGLEQIFQMEKTVCEYHGVELIDMTHNSIINRENIRTMLPDNVHPTVECHAVMARELARKINFV